MGTSKEMFLRMREDDFNSLSSETRELFTYVEVRDNDEWEQHKDDANYKKLKKAETKAKKDTQTYLFNKRHNK
jgi:hypothetical protein